MAARRLARIAGDLVGYVQLFLGAPEGNRPSVPELRSYLLAQLDSFLRDPAAQAVPEDEVAEARFAVVAWCDEMILRSNWLGREEWESDTLQFQLYRTRNAGDEFFGRLERLRPDQNEAREVYFLCLALGFIGRYADDEAARRTLMTQQYEQLRISGRTLDLSREPQLQTAAYDLAIRLPRARGSGVLRTLLAMTGVTLVVFGILWLILWYATGRVPLPPAV
jgi:type VI secretion system protein ImpK